MEPNTQPTQSGERVSQGLNGVRERARKNKQERFTALLHHVTVDLLRDSYYTTDSSVKLRREWMA
jgi:RNA-directed DNA polymerase